MFKKLTRLFKYLRGDYAISQDCPQMGKVYLIFSFKQFQMEAMRSHYRCNFGKTNPFMPVLMSENMWHEKIAWENRQKYIVDKTK